MILLLEIETTSNMKESNQQKRTLFEKDIYSKALLKYS